MSNKIYVGYFREQRSFYEIHDFERILGFDNEEKAAKICQKLILADVIKACSKKEFNLNFLNDGELSQQEEDINDTEDNKKRGYYFKFVGIAYVDDCIIKSYPKYLDIPSENGKTNLDICDISDNRDLIDRIENHLSLTLKVIKRLSPKEQQASLKLVQTNSNYDEIATEFSILEDYYQNGLYSNLETIIETNGEGEIDWDKTINETTAIIKSGKPFYVDLKTINTRTNEFDYFKQLHMAILTECSKHLKNADLLKYVGMKTVELSTMKLSQFGNDGYIKQRIEQELRTQFVTKKRNQLLYLLNYITHRKAYKYSNNVSLYGTNSFQVIWERVCKSVLNDLYKNKHRIQDIEYGFSPKIKVLIPSLIKDLKELEEYKDKTFENIMENASWELRKDFNSLNKDRNAMIYGLPRKPGVGLTPDLISINNNYFYILDAKYYLIEAEDDETSIYRQPGVQDVVKQFVYARAFAKFLDAAKFTGSGNAFLMPKRMSKWDLPVNNQTDSSENILMTYEGDVCFDLLQRFYIKRDNKTVEKNLDSIKIFEIYPEYIYKCFLQSHSCIEEFGSAFENYIKVNRTWNNSTYNDIHERTIIGFLRPEYYEYIKDRNEMIFYFHADKGFYSYDVHPDLLCCSSIKLFSMETESKKLRSFEGKALKGLLNQEMHLVTREKLSELLKNHTGCEVSLSENVDKYYYMNVTNVEIFDINQEEISVLEKKVSEYNGNIYLHDFAPKVVKNV